MKNTRNRIKSQGGFAVTELLVCTLIAVIALALAVGAAREVNLSEVGSSIVGLVTLDSGHDDQTTEAQVATETAMGHELDAVQQFREQQLAQ